MNVDRFVMAFAGTMVLLSVVLSQYHNVNWLWFTGFVGVNMLQAAFTGFCPLAMILKKVGLRPGNAFN
ncbi:MAG: YgaP family membrane protein [Oceanobacter sp.]